MAMIYFIIVVTRLLAIAANLGIFFWSMTRKDYSDECIN